MIRYLQNTNQNIWFPITFFLLFLPLCMQETVIAGVLYLEDVLPVERMKPITVIIDKPLKLKGNLRIPSNIYLKIEPKGFIDIEENNLVIPHIEAGLNKMFNPNAKGKVFIGSSIARIPQWWGAVADDHKDDTLAFQSWAASIQSNSIGQIPAGIYELSGTVGIYASNIMITAHGALFVQHNKNSITFDLNEKAVSDEENFIQNSIRWSGGRFHGSPDLTINNNNVGIRVRGITRGEISGVFGVGFGKTFIAFNPRDAFFIRDCHGYQNNIHVLIEDFQKKTANPQICNIEDCGWSTHYKAGIYIDGVANDLRILRSYFIGNDAVLIRTGLPHFSGQAIFVKDCSFEGGKEDGFYIRTIAEQAHPLRNFIIRDNTFQISRTKCIKIENVFGCNIDGNQFLSDQDGMIDIDAKSKKIFLGYNNYLGIHRVRQGIFYKCSRNEIFLSPNFIPVNSDKTVTLKISEIKASIVSLKIEKLLDLSNEEWRIIPPKAILLNLEIHNSDKKDWKTSLYIYLNEKENVENRIDLGSGFYAEILFPYSKFGSYISFPNSNDQYAVLKISLSALIY